MNRLAQALVCLTDPDAKKAYDRQLFPERPAAPVSSPCRHRPRTLPQLFPLPCRTWHPHRLFYRQTDLRRCPVHPTEPPDARPRQTLRRLPKI